MKPILLFCSLLGCLFATSLHAQTQIAYQGFEQSASDTWGLTFSRLPCNISGDIWDYSTGLSGLMPSQGTAFWAVQNLTGNCGNANGETLFFASTSVAGFTNVEILFDYDIVGFDNGDDVFYTVTIDGVAQPQVQLVNGASNFTTGGYVTETIAIPNGTSTVELEVLVDQNGGGDRAAFDNFILQGDPTAGCTHSTTQYAPDRGPAGTEVRITGVGFTNATTVTFSGLNASNVTFVSTTEIIATAPAFVSTGNIVVTENACDVTAGTYTVIQGAASCGTSFSDLIISEVYDNNRGALGYIEIFNGTGATIDLTNYQIDRYGSLSSTTITHSYTFPTSGVGSTIASGQVLVGRVNSGGSAQDFVFGGSTAGFNASDRLELVLIASSTVVDDFHDDVVGAAGYVYRRNLNVTGPNPTYVTSEWTTATSGDVSDLGTYNVSVGGAAPSITSQPSDASSCAMNFAVTATPSNGGTLSYQWFFNPNDGATAGWATVTAGDFPGAILTPGSETSDNLIIEGNLTDFDGYQFYVQVTENGSCSEVSEAVQFELTTGRFFRSVGTGDWTNSATWETATSAAGPWSPTCTYPTADNSDYIHILATHEVTADIDLTVDEVVIEFDGQLIIANNRLLEFANGPGTDLEILGILTDNGNGGGNGINFSNNGATWIYGTNGTIVKTGSSSVTQYRDNYEGGIASVPNTAIWRYRYTGNSSSISVITINMFYPNLYFESTNGAYSFSGAAEVFQGSSGFATIKGSLFIGTTGTASVEVFNRNTNATPMQILGGIIIGGNGFTGTSVLRNHQGSNIGTGMEVYGNLLIDNSGRLDYSDGSSAMDGVFRLHGNWINNNPGNGFSEGQSTVEFVGSTLQFASKVATGENFHNILVNKPNGFLQNDIQDMVIENDALFIRGAIRTSALSYIVFQADATATGASDLSYVEGPVVKETYTGTVTNFTYPTGNNNIYGPIAIQTRFHTGEPFIARYHNTGFGVFPTSYAINYNELDHVSRLEYWDLDERDNPGSSGEHLRVTLHWGPHSDVITPSTIRVAHYFTQAPSTSDRWEREGNSPVITGNAMRGSVESDWVTSFSPFTLGDVVRQASLPLNLLRFEANKVEQTTDLVWEVANEHAGDVYHLQRSSDGVNFETLVTFEAEESNSTAVYRHVDETPLFGYNYYRIHQVDYAGVSDYSPTKVVEFNRATVIQVYPNPVRNSLQLELPDATEQYTIKVVDALGRILLSTTRSGLNSRQQLDVSTLAAGTYILQVETDRGAVNSQKITVVR
jgi:hypothetical protein